MLIHNELKDKIKNYILMGTSLIVLNGCSAIGKTLDIAVSVADKSLSVAEKTTDPIYDTGEKIVTKKKPFYSAKLQATGYTEHKFSYEGEDYYVRFFNPEFKDEFRFKEAVGNHGPTYALKSVSMSYKAPSYATTVNFSFGYSSNGKYEDKVNNLLLEVIAETCRTPYYDYQVNARYAKPESCDIKLNIFAEK